MTAGSAKSLRRVIMSKSGLTCIAEHTTGARRLNAFPRDSMDVAAMDLNLPDFSGVDVTARLKARLPDISVVILTVYNDAEHIFKALRAGASGYLLKQATAGEILGAIAEAHRGGAPMTSEIARKVIAAFHEPRPAPGRHGGAGARAKWKSSSWWPTATPSKEIADKLAITLSTVCWYLQQVQKAPCAEPHAGGQQAARQTTSRHTRIRNCLRGWIPARNTASTLLF